MKFSKNCASNTKKEVKGYYHRKLLFKKIDTNMKKENSDAKQSVSLDENPRLHLTKFHDGMTEPILFSSMTR